MTKRIQGLRDLRKVLRDREGNGFPREEIWFNRKTGEIECCSEGWGRKNFGPGKYFGSNFAMLDLDYNDYNGCKLNDKIKYIKNVIAKACPEYATKPKQKK